MGASGFTIFRKVTFPHIKWAFLYGVVLCAARAMGEFGAVSVLSGHLRGKTNTLPLQVEILFGDNKYVPAFAVASILVILAVIILIIRSIVEYKGKEGGIEMYVELKNINKNFGDYKASDNVNFGVEKGKLIGFLGPSGSGKTTILRMIAGLETPDSGDIIIDGVSCKRYSGKQKRNRFCFSELCLIQIYDGI